MESNVSGLIGLQKPWYINLWNTVARVPNNQSVPRSLFIALSRPLVLVHFYNGSNPPSSLISYFLPQPVTALSFPYRMVTLFNEKKKLFETKLPRENNFSNKIVGKCKFSTSVLNCRKSCTVGACCWCKLKVVSLPKGDECKSSMGKLEGWVRCWLEV